MNVTSGKKRRAKAEQTCWNFRISKYLHFLRNEGYPCIAADENEVGV